MNRAEMLKELDRIIDVGIVNAHHDTEVLKKVREQLKESHYQSIRRVLKESRGAWSGKYDIHEDEGKMDIVLRDFDQCVVLIFDENGVLIG